jgi:diguanylate cyclase (GGDEF)-like protein
VSNPGASDSYPRILPVSQRVQRRGRDLERFVNLWRLGLLSALTTTLLATQFSSRGLRADQEWALVVLGGLLFAALAFQLYLAWFSWSERFGRWVVGADLAVVAGLLVGFVVADRPLVATNSQTTFMGYFIVIALAGLRSDSRVARGLVLAVPLSYALVVFLAVAWRQAPFVRPDPTFGSFSWETQLIRLILLAAVTWITQYDVALGATDRAEAQRDPLTGVYNRRFLEEFLSRELPRARRRRQPLSVLLVDLDGFKQFNDTYGHLAGDEMLVAVASSLAAAVRGADIVARYGGDEFVVVLPDTPGETARRVARELGGVVPRQVRLSVGVGCLGERHATAEALLEAADRALLRAKQAGGGAVVAV